jgi:hypothetical protein
VIPFRNIGYETFSDRRVIFAKNINSETLNEQQVIIFKNIGYELLDCRLGNYHQEYWLGNIFWKKWI